MKIIKNTGRGLILIFALIGFVLVVGYFGVRFGFTNTAGIIDIQKDAFYASKDKTVSMATSKIWNDDSWKNTEEWGVFKEAVLKDTSVLIKAANKADIKPRLVLSVLAVEQLRLFFSTREVYKEIFAPLKILGVQSQFSWGIMGIKQETAVNIENYLKDPASSYYPGKIYEHLLDFSTKDTDRERFERLTDEHDRFYSYLYASVYMKEIETQWKRAKYDISGRPEIMATLYNIGFDHSKPKPSPQVGGSEIQIGTKTYSFGALAAHIYYSNELLNEFPR